MAVKFIQENKKQKYLILIFIVIIAVAVLIWWFGFMKGKGSGEPSTGSVSSSLINIGIDFNLLESSEFKGLQIFKEIAPFRGQKGRENPFLPY